MLLGDFKTSNWITEALLPNTVTFTSSRPKFILQIPQIIQTKIYFANSTNPVSHGSTNTKLTLWVVFVDTNAPFMKTLAYILYSILRKYNGCVFSWNDWTYSGEAWQFWLSTEYSVQHPQTRFFPYFQSIFILRFWCMM